MAIRAFDRLIGGMGSGLRRVGAGAGVDDGGSARGRRVALVALATATLGVLDLAFTLTYVRVGGMIELNPLARGMIAIGGMGELVRFKLLTIALSSGVLYLIRHRRGAEWCAWLSLLAMLLLSLHWVRYTHLSDELGPEMIAQSAATDQRWVAITD